MSIVKKESWNNTLYQEVVDYLTYRAQGHDISEEGWPKERQNVAHIKYQC